MLTIIPISKEKEWDEKVKSFKDYNPYYLSGYVKPFSIHGDGEPILFYYESGDTRGMNVSMMRDISEIPELNDIVSKQQYWDLATPYGYGGWIIEGGNMEALFEEYSNYCSTHNIVSEFVRFNPMEEIESAAHNFYTIQPLGNTVHIDTRDEDEIWQNFTSKNRNVIRKAQKNGITIKRGFSYELLKEFKSIYDATMDKDHAEEYYYFEDEFYRSIAENFGDNASVFYATYEDRIIAASIMIYANSKMYYHLSGSIREYSSLAASNLMLYEAALWGSRQGNKYLYLGGGLGSQEDSLYKFKKAFNKTDTDKRFCIGKKIFNEDVYAKLVKARHFDEEVRFFPQYRG